MPLAAFLKKKRLNYRHVRKAGMDIYTRGNIVTKRPEIYSKCWTDFNTALFFLLKRENASLTYFKAFQWDYFVLSVRHATLNSKSWKNSSFV
jgi:hypothetical protein